MEDIKEKYINKSVEPVTIKGTKNILNQMNKCVCKIYNGYEGTGFFTKIPFNSELLPVLITNNHVLGENDIQSNKIISLYLNYDKDIKNIKMDEERKRYTNEILDITIIEIKEKKDNIKNEYIDLDDNIINYFKLNKNENLNFYTNIYSNKSIYILNYPEGKNVLVSYGQLLKLINSEIIHICNTKYGSSGSPILLVKNQKLIGVHYGTSNNHEINKGRLIIYSIIEFQKIKNNPIIIYKEGKNRGYEKILNNYISAEFDINKENRKIRIINSYEQYIKENNIGNREKEYENEKEIKENCEIRINDEKIPFIYFHQFNKKGKYNIKYIFKNNITRVDYMFYNVYSLNIINLYNFYTE